MNAPPCLRDLRILVLEDDYYLATDLQRALERAGATVIGPFADEAEAGRALDAEQPDCAFLDVNLGHGPSYRIPQALVRLNVPFAFVTGYDRGAIPMEFAGVKRFEKPIEPQRVVEIARALLRQG